MADKTGMPSAGALAARQAAVVSCWMCGIGLHYSQMVPDGGNACDDIRWYCQDARACTERWILTRRQMRASALPGR
jgi:hypothetical protein